MGRETRLFHLVPEAHPGNYLAVNRGESLGYNEYMSDTSANNQAYLEALPDLTATPPFNVSEFKTGWHADIKLRTIGNMALHSEAIQQDVEAIVDAKLAGRLALAYIDTTSIQFIFCVENNSEQEKNRVREFALGALSMLGSNAEVEHSRLIRLRGFQPRVVE